MAAPKDAVRIEVDILPPIPTIQAGLRGAALALRNLKKPLELAVRSVIRPRIYNNFDDGGPESSWQPLAISTVAWKFNNGFARNALDPLKRMGKLQKAAQQANLWRITADSAEMVFLPGNVEYGIYHQFGYNNVRTETEVPARPWAVILDSDIDRIQGIIETYAMIELGVG